VSIKYNNKNDGIGTVILRMH